MLVNTSLTGLLTDVVLQQGDLYFSAELLHKSIIGAATIPHGMERRGAFHHVGYLVLQKRKRVEMKEENRKKKRKRDDRFMFDIR